MLRIKIFPRKLNIVKRLLTMFNLFRVVVILNIIPSNFGIETKDDFNSKALEGTSLVGLKGIMNKGTT